MRRSILAAVLLLCPLAARAGDVFVSEGNAGFTAVQIVIQSKTPANGSITGQYQTVDGSATVADNDYIPATGDFIIFSGQTTSQPITLQIVGDTKIESDETFSLSLFNIINGASLDPGPYTIHIVNDDIPVVTVSKPSVFEGDSGLSALAFTVTLTTPAASAVSATYATADVTATAGQDYQPASGTLTFNPGETTKVVNVNVIGDTLFENNETLTLTVTPAGGAPAVGTGTIINDDAPDISVGDVRIAEGNAGITPFTFVVSLSAPSSLPVIAFYTTANGTATAGEDYQTAFGNLTFAPGVTQQSATVAVLGDTKFEPDETFTLTVQIVGGGKATATGTIINDDAAPVAAIRIVSGNGQRGRLGRPLAQPLVVEVTNSAGGPAPGTAVTWKVSKGDAIVSPATSTTNDQGRASTTVTLNSVGAVEVQASVNGLAPVTFTFTSETLFEQRATGPVAVPVARALDAVCAQNDGNFALACRALSLVDDAQLTPVLERIAPQQSGAQSKAASEFISAVTRGVASRLASLRHGARRFDVQKLSLNVGGRPIPLAMLGVAAGFSRPTAGGLLMDGRLKPAATPDEKDYNGWSGFVSGSLGSGDRVAGSGQVGFDLDTQGLMAGVDRQFGDTVLGLSAHRMSLDSKLGQGAGKLDTTAYALSLYGSRSGLFARGNYDGLHFDGALTLGRNRYDAEHVVDILGLPLSRARSKNDGNIQALTAGTGLDAHRGKTDFELSLSGTWSRAHIDDLSEEGSGPLVLFVQGHDIDSTVANLGVNVRSVWAVPFGDLLPSARGEVIHEFKSGARLVTARFLRDRLNTAFTVPVDKPDATYGKLSAGLQAVFAHGVSAFVEVTQDVLRSDLHFRTVQFNVSKSF